METFKIKGGKSLNGEIGLSGAKNAATKMMVASLLTDEPCILRNFPFIGDVDITAELCEKIGSKIESDKFDKILRIQTPEIKNSKVSELSRRNRIPILAIGPLLARVGQVEVPILGGDKLGPRPVNLHIKALEALGAKIEVNSTSYVAEAPNGLKGTEIEFDFPSVGATENTLLAAVLAKGKTVLKNAALEPEVIDLVKMLQKMGAIIEMGANRDFYIDGVGKLGGVDHTILPDRIEAVSFACLAIATGGKIMVKGAIQDHLITFLNSVRRLGAQYEINNEGIAFSRAGSLKALNIRTAVHPGFMTDWQQPLAVVLTQAEGVSTIHETIYEDRFGYTEDLNSLGAKIKINTDCYSDSPCRFKNNHSPHFAEITGPTYLSSNGQKMQVRDLRSGMVNIIAALTAQGESEILGIEEIDRGYENIDGRLKGLGAEIERVE